MIELIHKHYRKIILGGMFVIGVLFTANYMFQQQAQKSKAAIEGIQMNFNPPNISKNANEEFETIIEATSSQPLSVRGYAFDVTFDKSKLAVKKITYQLGVVSNELGDTDSTLTAVNNNGKIKIVGEIREENGQVIGANTKIPVVKITFRSLSNSPSLVQITGTANAFYKINPDFSLSTVSLLPTDLSVNNAATSTVTPAVTSSLTSAPTPTCDPRAVGGCGLLGSPTPVCQPKPTSSCDPNSEKPCIEPQSPPGGWCGSGGNATLNLKLKFQGILKKPSDQYNTMKVKVTLVNQNTNAKVARFADFKADDRGIWSGSVNFDARSADSYKLLIKGPKHIQKAVCTALPTETYPGSYICDRGQILLKAGTNDLDFSGIYQLVGDLPEQDGIVNSFDTSLVLNSIGKTDAESLRIADLNLDSTVNFQDFSLVIAALSVRADEGDNVVASITDPTVKVPTPTNVPVTPGTTVAPPVPVPTGSSSATGDLIRDGSTYPLYTMIQFEYTSCKDKMEDKKTGVLDQLSLSLLDQSKSFTNIPIDYLVTENLFLGNIKINDLIVKDVRQGDHEIVFSPQAIFKATSPGKANFSSNLNDVEVSRISWCTSNEGCFFADVGMPQGKYLLLKHLKVKCS